MFKAGVLEDQAGPSPLSMASIPSHPCSQKSPSTRPHLRSLPQSLCHTLHLHPSSYFLSALSEPSPMRKPVSGSQCAFPPLWQAVSPSEKTPDLKRALRTLLSKMKVKFTHSPKYFLSPALSDAPAERFSPRTTYITIVSHSKALSLWPQCLKH